MSNALQKLLEQIDTLLPKDDQGNFVVFSQSISGEDDPSGLDANDNALERSDVVHDFLVYLAEQMTEMHKTKRQKIEAFRTDLEGVVERDVLEKLCKGKQEKTLFKNCEACKPFVDKNSGSSRTVDESLAWNEDAFKQFAKLLAGRISNLNDLVGVYRNHASEFKALTENVERTDGLIDQIVYKLYGLTDEEIAIVERPIHNDVELDSTKGV